MDALILRLEILSKEKEIGTLIQVEYDLYSNLMDKRIRDEKIIYKLFESIFTYYSKIIDRIFTENK